MVVTRMENLAGHLILTTGWRRNLYAWLAGAVSAMSMPPFDFPIVLFLTFPVLVWLLDGLASEPVEGTFSRLRAWFLPGFFFGFGYFLAGMWWIGSALLVESDEFAWALPLAVLLLPAILALFWGIGTAIAGLAWRDGAQRLFLLAASFAIAEILRGHVATGLPWNAISYAVYFTPLLMQSASVLGIYGMTAFAVFLFSSPAIIVPGDAARPVSRKPVFALALVLATLHVGYGIWRLPAEPAKTVDQVSLRLVQPAIDQREKWLSEKEAEIFNRYLSLSTSPVEGGRPGLAGTTLLIWPESAFPFLLTERRDALAAISAMLPEGTSLVTGAVRVEQALAGSRSGYVFNSVYVIDAEGEIAGAADKVHLVPFGEYLPLQEIAEKLGLEQLARANGGFTAGSSRSRISIGTAPDFLPLICYEIIFSGDVMPEGSRPGWILNLTNDAWFGLTPGPYQHLRQAVVRAVEEGLPLVRVANSGISAVSDPYGRVISHLPLGERGVLDSPLPEHVDKTLFGTYSKIIVILVIGGFLLIGLFPLRNL